MGMSGVGKTHVAKLLRQQNWFHYSVDYRIGSHHLRDAILWDIKALAIRIPKLARLLEADAIYIEQNLERLDTISHYLGKVGNPNVGGLSLPEFRQRQHLFNQAEIRAIQDAATFHRNAQSIYGYERFVLDSGGSLCDLYEDLDDPAFTNLMQEIQNLSILVYIEADESFLDKLITRARQHPKPLYYRETFFTQQVAAYLEHNQHRYVAEIEPDTFIQWIFPRLLKERAQRYRTLAKRYGVTVPAKAVLHVKSGEDFLDLVAACRS